MNLTFGVIGCGPWGRNYVRVLQEIRQTVIAVADPLGGNLGLVRERFPRVAALPTYPDLLNDPRIDAVVVATPASTHAEVAIAALRAGKHVLVEKPLAANSAEGERLSELAAERKRTLMVAHTFLYNDGVRKTKELARAMETGRIYYLAARRTHAGTIREDVDVMWDLAPHDLSIFEYILDEQPLWVSAVGGSYLRPPRRDVAFLSLGYPSGVIGHVQVSWVDAGKVREVVAIGSRRRILFDDLNLLESVRVFEKGVAMPESAESFGEFRYLLRDGDIVSPHLTSREPLKNQCLHFVECVRTGQKPLTDGPSGVRIVRTLEAADRSLRENGRPVEIR